MPAWIFADVVMQGTLSSTAFSYCGMQDEATAMREALQNIMPHAIKRSEGISISESFIEGLLSRDENLTPCSDADGDEGHCNFCIRQTYDQRNVPLYERMRGMPQRPFYRDLSRRLLAIRKHKNEASTDENATDSNYIDAAAFPFLPASDFGVTELQCMNSLVPEPPQEMSSVEECTKWLREAGENGIIATLGMRRTIGTVSKCFERPSGISNEDDSAEQCLFPPSASQLIASARGLHKPATKSKLTVAARALAKHAHRGRDAFFGAVRGSEAEKNERAEGVVRRLIGEAAWINVHAFGGLDEARPVVEVRTVEGYGARWSAVWRESAFSPEDVRFRGFLEPNREGGHEDRWRH